MVEKSEPKNATEKKQKLQQEDEMDKNKYEIVNRFDKEFPVACKLWLDKGPLNSTPNPEQAELTKHSELRNIHEVTNEEGDKSLVTAQYENE